MRLAVVGHIEWVEFVPVPRLPEGGDVIHAGEVFAKAAGGGGVVAGVFAELGAEVDFFTALGEDQNGHAAKEQLERKGIRMHVAWRSAQPTRRAFTLLEDGGERTIVTIGTRLDPLGSDELDWGRLGHADGVYVTAGDPAALERARHARVLVASPRATAALSDGDAVIDALIYSARDRDECAWAERFAERARLLVETEGAQGGHFTGPPRAVGQPRRLPAHPRTRMAAVTRSRPGSRSHSPKVRRRARPQTSERGKAPAA